MATKLATTRKLTIIAKDPGFRLDGKSGPMAFMQVDVPAEILASGPTGYRVKVVDYNATDRVVYKNAQVYNDAEGNFLDPFAPGKGENFSSPKYQKRLINDPNFHAQNVYAIVMRTLGRFERSLGRRVSWGDGRHQLHIAPHAFEQANAYYSEPDRALLFGYFKGDSGENIFICLSHDIVVHEATHAILDGLRNRYSEPSSPDQAAFHEGFSDIVALLSIFSLEPIVKAALTRSIKITTKAGIELVAAKDITPKALRSSILLGIAKEFGSSSEGGGRDALRRSIELEPSQAHLDALTEEHDRGEIIVAAVMHAFLELWHERIKSLGRFDGKYYNVAMVVEEGAKLAEHILNMCIRGIDYCPPTDIDFGQYLSGILTADYEIMPDDQRFGYRKALQDSFASYGILPPEAARDDGRWPVFQEPESLIYSRTNYEILTRDRNECFRFLWENRSILKISDYCYVDVLSVDTASRLGPDGIALKETICQYAECADIFGSEVEKVLGIEKRPEGLSTRDRIEAFGGGVVIFDQYGRVKYHICNPLKDGERQSRRIEHLLTTDDLHPAKAGRNRFALMHMKRMGG